MNGFVSPGHRGILGSAGLAFVATAGAKGPNVNPTWFLWDDERENLLISLTDRRQKYRNLLRNPEVAVCLQDPGSLYRYIELRGKVESIERDENHSLINALAGKYLGQKKFSHDPADGHRVVVRIAFDHVHCFG